MYYTQLVSSVDELQSMRFVINSLTYQIQIDWAITWTGAGDIHLENLLTWRITPISIHKTDCVSAGSIYDFTIHLIHI